jgi:selenocysteine-specific elongation factor
MVALVNVGAPVRPAGPATSAATTMHPGGYLAAVAGPSGKASGALIRALGAQRLLPDGTAAHAPGEPGAAWTQEPCAVSLGLPSGDRISLLGCAWASPVARSASSPGLADCGDLAWLTGLGPHCAVLFAVPAALASAASLTRHLALAQAIGAQVLAVVVLTDTARAAATAGQVDPVLATERLAWQACRAGLDSVACIAVDLATGAGLPALRTAVGQATARLPAPDPGAPVRMWIVSSCQQPGGREVTGLLPDGTVRVGDVLSVTPSMRAARVQAIDWQGTAPGAVTGAAWLRLRLSGAGAADAGRGSALVQPGRWTLTDVMDVRLGPGPQAITQGAAGQRLLPRVLTVRIGSACTAARVRPLAAGLARLTLRDPIPLHVADRMLVQERPRPVASGYPPALARPTPMAAPAPGVACATVLDVTPPELGHRGAVAAAARSLADWPNRPTASDLVRRHGTLRASALLAMGIEDQPPPVAGEWIADPERWAALAQRLVDIVVARASRQQALHGISVEAAGAALGLPDRRLAAALVRPPLRLRDGAIHLADALIAPAVRSSTTLPDGAMAAVQVLRASLAQAPFAAPEADRLRRLGLDSAVIDAAVRAGLLLRISDQIVLAPGADTQAQRILSTLPQPFTAAQARQALASTRRVVIPLLEYLDRAGVTERLPDDRRKIRHAAHPAATAAAS